MNEALLDRNRIRRSFAAAASGYDAVAVLQRRVGEQLLQAFPAGAGAGVTLDLGCGTGFIAERLLQVHGAAELLAVDLALPMLQVSRSKLAARPIHYVCADAERLPLADSCVAQIYSNLALQWLEDLPTLFRELHRVLQPQGLLQFTSFGPATLMELKQAWHAVDAAVHVNQFETGERLNAALAAAGFEIMVAESVIEQCHYGSVLELMRELKGLGAHNVNHGRKTAPTTRTELERMMRQYPQAADGIVASYEIFYYQARA